MCRKCRAHKAREMTFDVAGMDVIDALQFLMNDS